jgi:hypothetical protein
MKKILILLFSVGLIVNSIYSKAQNCSLLSKGMKFTFEVTTYPFVTEKDAVGFMKMNQKGKDKVAAEHQAGIISGKIAPKSVTTSIYTITDITPTGEYVFSTTIGDKKFDSYLNCKNDTFYILRSKGMIPLVSKNDTMGFYSYGAQAIPLNLSVGKNTPGYIDESVMATTAQNKVKQNFNVGDGGYNYSGYVTATVDYDISYRTLKFYQGGIVNSEENVNISGKDYKSFVVGTEMWSKTDNKSTVSVEKEKYFNDPINNKINKQIQKNYDKGGKKLDAKLNQFTGANEEGYIVTYKEEWVIPGITIAKTTNYDQWGCINSTIVLKSIE